MKQRSKLAQKRIDYIAYSNPKAVSSLLATKGITPPKNIRLLPKTIRQVIRKEGKPFVKELIKIHPDRNLVLRLSKAEDGFNTSTCEACGSHSYNGEDNHCGSCGHSAYSGDFTQYIKDLSELRLEQLEALYEKKKQAAAIDIGNEQLAEEVRIIWNEIRIRKGERDYAKQTDKMSDEQSSTPSTDTPMTTKLDSLSAPDMLQLSKEEALLFLGVAVVLGGIVVHEFAHRRLQVS